MAIVSIVVYHFNYFFYIGLIENWTQVAVTTEPSLLLLVPGRIVYNDWAVAVLPVPARNDLPVYNDWAVTAVADTCT